MAYQYDIFLSYMHDPQMEVWVIKHLKPFLKSFVGNALNRPVSIFLDRDGIEAGDSWPLRLQQAIATSRCIVPVWSPLYFHSEWCRRECISMLNREEQTGCRTVNNPKGIVLPVTVFDGEFFPNRARDIQWLDCSDFWIIGDGFQKTEKYVVFQDVLKEWSIGIAKAVHRAPEWHESWQSAEWLHLPDETLMPKPIENFEFTGLQ